VDLRTLFFVEASLLFLFGLTMIVNSIGHPSQKGNYWFAASNFCGGFGLLLHSAKPGDPKIFTMVLANVFLFVELSFLNKAIAEFLEIGRNVWLYLIALSALMTYGMFYSAILHPDLTLRLEVISVITISTAVCSAVLVFRSLSHSDKIPSLVMGTLLVAYATTNTVRVLTLWSHQNQSFYHIWLDRTLIAGLSFAYLWMTAARLRTDLERIAGTDALTGTLNRRAIERETIIAVERSRERRGCISALMIDVDYFKQINDSHGHHAGDLALRAIADCVRETIRAGDLVARLGGDEFLVLMPNATGELARIAAERIHSELATLRIPSDTGPFGVQVSIGITTLDSEGLTLEDIMKLGDRALYAVKAQNRQVAGAPSGGFDMPLPNILNPGPRAATYPLPVSESRVS
jgi:diguanylate cyclase (GGDEF)-like protein